MKIIKDDETGCIVNITAPDGQSHLEACKADLSGQLIDDDTAHVLMMVLQVAVTGTLAVGGMVTNTINIVVFIKMGLNDAVNISLLGLAVSDMCSLIFSFWEAICFNPWFEDGAPIVYTEIEYITGCWPHICFVRVASYITAFVTLERCLCIAMPLKVKSIITKTRTKVVIVAIFVIVSVTSAPEYYVNQVVWKFYPEKNRTMLGIVFVEDRLKFEGVTLIMNNIIMQLFAFIAVVTCTVILVIELNRKAKWRQQTAKGDNTSSKDKKVIKMITFISTIFIGSNLPCCVIFVAMAATPRLHPTGVNYNMLYIIWAIVYVMESINSSVNIVVYLNMSSKYRTVFYKTFFRRDIDSVQVSEQVKAKGDATRDISAE